MTITTSWLDELERNARGEMAGDGCCVPVAPDVTLQLVAIARAALAWSEARDDVRAFADEIDALYPGPITVGHEVRREALGGVVKARAVALEAALRGAP